MAKGNSHRLSALETKLLHALQVMTVRQEIECQSLRTILIELQRERQERRKQSEKQSVITKENI